jgi:flagellar biosynthesis/type III secretory pathway chaperone
MTTVTDTDQLAALVASKLQVLSLLKRSAQQQLALIEAGEMTTLLKLLGAKQTLLSQLQAIEKRLDPFRDEDPECRHWGTPEARADCQRQADHCAQLHAELLELEKSGEGKMVQRRDAAAARLQGVQCAAEASHAYAAGGVDSTSRFEVCDEG